MSNLVEFAENELNRVLKSCKDSESIKVQQVINKDILDIVKIFSEQGHSGFSAHYTLNNLTRLLDYKPITPLTGEDDEWTKLDYGEDIAYQNKRCPSIFKRADGTAYNTEGKIFSSNNGHTWYNCKDSSVEVIFPYEVPKNPECVIIDNGEERNKILNNVSVLIDNLMENDNKDVVTAIDEEQLLKDILSEDKFKDLENVLVSVYSIKKPLYSINDCEYLWQVVDLIMESDKIGEED